MLQSSQQQVSQAISQGFFPKFRVVHTSRKVHGQVYLPLVNMIMMVLTVSVVLVFRESKRLGAAYGMRCNLLVLCTLLTQWPHQALRCAVTCC